MFAERASRFAERNVYNVTSAGPYGYVGGAPVKKTSNSRKILSDRLARLLLLYLE
jgi:hypothetical protein